MPVAVERLMLPPVVTTSASVSDPAVAMMCPAVLVSDTLPLVV